MAIPWPAAFHRLAYHKPAQAHPLQHNGDEVKLADGQAAEQRRHLALQALQDKLGQPHHLRGREPAHSRYAAVVPGKDADADREHGDRSDVRKEKRPVVHTAARFGRNFPFSRNLSAETLSNEMGGSSRRDRAGENCWPSLNFLRFYALFASCPSRFRVRCCKGLFTLVRR